MKVVVLEREHLVAEVTQSVALGGVVRHEVAPAVVTEVVEVVDT